jgi:hypothetical protein
MLLDQSNQTGCLQHSKGVCDVASGDVTQNHTFLAMLCFCSLVRRTVSTNTTVDTVGQASEKQDLSVP